jgi:methyl-accepting chemotaxis protein
MVSLKYKEKIMTRSTTVRRIGIPTSLSAKITASFSVIAILFLANVGKTYLDSTQTQTRLVQITDESLPLFLNATEITESIYSMEPALLAILETRSTADFQRAIAQYQSVNTQLQQQLIGLNTLALSQPIASSVKGKRTAITDAIATIESLIASTSQTQSELIQTISQFNNASRTLADIEESLKPLISDFAYELTDDYLISLIQEMAASANYGMVIIEKLKSATNPKTVSQLQTQLATWIRDFDSFMGMLPATAGDDAALYRTFLKDLSSMTNLIKVTAQGEFDNDANTYSNGLQSIKQTQVALISQQTDNLKSIRQSMSEALALTDQLVQLGFQELKVSTTDSRNVLSSQIRMGLISGIIALLLVLFISTYITRFFRRSINELKVDLDQLAQGEIAVKPKSHRRDEFGAINAYVERVTLGLKDIVIGIGQANEKINDGVERVARHANKTRDFAEDQKHELDMVATALTEMSATASEVANHASDTHDRINTAGQLSAQGRNNMKTTKDMINQVSNQSEVTNDVIQSLASGVQNIESILNTIGGIAEQTNLLALNAAIEAARAGEQGRGFAVVADEVRALASRTQSSTLEIKEMTEKMLKDSNQAVEVMEKSSELVNQSVTSAQVADDTIAQFDQLMEEVLDLSRLIATASEEQAATVNELNTNVHRVSNLAEQTSEAAESSQQTGVELDTMALELREKISRFHISNS